MANGLVITKCDCGISVKMCFGFIIFLIYVFVLEILFFMVVWIRESIFFILMIFIELTILILPKKIDNLDLADILSMIV